MKSERGQLSTPVWIIYGLLILFIVAIVIVTFIGVVGEGVPFIDSLSNSISYVSEGFMKIFGGIFNVLLNLRGDQDIQFLMVVTFILIFIIISATLDSFNLFGDTDTVSSRVLNLVAGIIVSAIGVRFLPQDMWLALTVPSSAFVATILAGIVFVPLTMLTLAAGRHPWLVKLGWIGYIVTFGYILLNPDSTVSNSVKLAYGVFVILAGIMLFFDSTVRRFFYREKAKYDAEDLISNVNLVKRRKLREELEEMQKTYIDSNASKSERARARKRIEQIKMLLRQASD